MKKIQMVDLSGQYKYLKNDILKKWKKLCESSSFILGEEVELFEQEYAKYIGRKYAIGVCSGTSALHLALEAMGARGKNVITTPLTFIATCEAVIHAGGKIEWADTEPDYYTIDPAKIKTLIPAEAEIIVPVHLYGLPADMDSITKIAEEYNLKIVEDCAQSHGSKINGQNTGTFGDVGCFSFYPGKNLGAYGDAGCIVCDDKDTAELIKRLRTHGSRDKYYHTEIGYNYRIDALQAAVLRIKMKYLDEWNEARRVIAGKYNEALKDTPIKLPTVKDGYEHVYHQYVMIAPKRDALQQKLKEDGIDSAVHYPVPIHMQPSFSFMGFGEDSFPEAEKVARECLSLPMYPELTDSQINYIVDKVREFYA